MTTRPLPSDRHIHSSIDHLAKVDLGQTRQRLLVALSLERRNPSTPDGYARSTGTYLGSSTGPRVIVDTPTGPESVEVTSVELAVIAREQDEVDEYRAALEHALRALDTINRATTQLLGALDVLENLGATADRDQQQRCWAMERVGHWEPAHRRTGINGKTYALGRWAYDWLRTTGRLPSIEECKLHAQGRKVRLPVDVAQRTRTATRAG